MPNRDPHLDQLLEEAGNVGYVCERHASKPGGFVGQDPASFVGRHIKLGFPTLVGSHEHMWVLVDRVEPSGELIGSLQNEPTLALSMGDFHHGDLFAFEVDEIEAVEPP